jgi:hypothetical protein
MPSSSKMAYTWAGTCPRTARCPARPAARPARPRTAPRDAVPAVRAAPSLRPVPDCAGGAASPVISRAVRTAARFPPSRCCVPAARPLIRHSICRARVTCFAPAVDMGGVKPFAAKQRAALAPGFHLVILAQDPRLVRRGEGPPLRRRQEPRNPGTFPSCATCTGALSHNGLEPHRRRPLGQRRLPQPAVIIRTHDVRTPGSPGTGHHHGQDG